MLNSFKKVNKAYSDLYIISDYLRLVFGSQGQYAFLLLIHKNKNYCIFLIKIKSIVSRLKRFYVEFRKHILKF